MASVRDPKIIVALDHLNITQTKALVTQLNPEECRLKVGVTLFTHYGPTLIAALMKSGFEIFLDLKFHDIPQQVAGACSAAADLGVWMMNVHIQGGRAMLESAYHALAKTHFPNKPLLIGVTVLTSFDDGDLQAIGVQEKIAVLVPRFAKLAQEVGLDGVVCSPHEVSTLRAQFKKDFLLVTPGIRPAGGTQHDQKRIMTPQAAMMAGSSYLVIGRPITDAADPASALRRINAEIQV